MHSHFAAEYCIRNIPQAVLQMPRRSITRHRHREAVTVCQSRAMISLSRNDRTEEGTLTMASQFCHTLSLQSSLRCRAFCAALHRQCRLNCCRVVQLIACLGRDDPTEEGALSSTAQLLRHSQCKAHLLHCEKQALWHDELAWACLILYPAPCQKCIQGIGCVHNHLQRMHITVGQT